MKRRILTACMLVMLVLPTQIAFSQSGTLDSSFAEHGSLILDFNSLDRGSRVLTTDEGKILFAGFSTDRNASSRANNLLLKFDEYGQLDLEFGDNGIVYIDSLAPTPGQNVIRAFELQKDEKLLVAVGASLEFPFGVNIFRYDKDGHRDPSFGEYGKAYVRLPGNEPEYAPRELKIQQDGKILILGNEYLMRLDRDGMLDNSFGIDGILKEGIEAAVDIAVQLDGKILILGQHHEEMSGRVFSMVSRFQPNGTIDSTFGEYGTVRQEIGLVWDDPVSIEVHEDGKILMLLNSGLDFVTTVLIRFNSDGTMDHIFGNNGVVTMQASQPTSLARSMVIGADGKILVSGIGNYFYSDEQFVFRLLENGSLDQSFGNNGIANISVEDATVADITLQHDGKILLAGTANHDNFFWFGDFLIMRMIQDVSVGFLDEQVIDAVYFYPNPAEERMTIQYSMKRTSRVSIRLLSGSGAEVATLFSGERTAGDHSETLMLPGNLISGPYLLTIKSKYGEKSLWIIKN